MRASSRHPQSVVLPGRLPLLPSSSQARRELAAALLSGLLSRTRGVAVRIEPPAELADVRELGRRRREVRP